MDTATAEQKPVPPNDQSGEVVIKEKKGADKAAKSDDQTGEQTTWYGALFGIYTKGPFVALVAEQEYKLRKKPHHDKTNCLRAYRNRRPFCYKMAYFADLSVLIVFILLTLGIVGLVVYFGFNEIIGQ
jgi:hypothetical protein